MHLLSGFPFYTLFFCHILCTQASLCIVLFSPFLQGALFQIRYCQHIIQKRKPCKVWIEDIGERCCHGNWTASACCCDETGFILGFWKVVFNSLQAQGCASGFNLTVPCQVDLLKSTALPVMKKFGIDGEGFDIKVRTSWYSVFVEMQSNPGMDKVAMHVILYLNLSLVLHPQVVKRGMAPGGGGEVVFTCPVRKTVRPVQLTDPGKIKRIRGVAYPF